MPKAPNQIQNRRLFAGLAVVLLSLTLLYTASAGSGELNGGDKAQEVSLTQIFGQIRSNEVDKIEIVGQTIEATLKNGHEVKAVKEPEDSFLRLLSEQKIDPAAIPGGIEVRDLSSPPLLDAAINLLPVVVTIIFIVLIMRQAKNVGGDMFAFGKSRAKLFAKDKPSITFASAAGVEEAKQELKEVVDFLKNPQKYRALGARVPKGVLLVGPSGTGKTLLARATAGEAGVPFFSIAGSEFMEMLVGVGASRVRDLFATAKASAPSIIFIDEIESVGRHRGLGMMSQGEQEQTLNQILVEMDGFDPNTGVIVLAATNKPELLDPALVRPGRFDRRIMLDLPDIEGRQEIIRIHMKGKPFDPDAVVRRIAERTVGFSGADIENMLNEAAILAARNGQKEVTAKNVEEAATKVELGPERKRLQSDQERKMSAYHEAGHAVASFYLPHTDPVHRVSIVSRGSALGFTMIAPLKDRYNQTKTELLERVTSLLGGRAAEELVFNEMTVGAGSDLERASRIARAMVLEFGMGRLGPQAFSDNSLGNGWPYSPPKDRVNLSDKTVQELDAEVKSIIDDCFESARNILSVNREKLDRVAEELAKKETLEREEFEEMMKA